MNTAVNFKNQSEVRREGLDALIDRLGRVGAIRFLQLFSVCGGDSVQEKHASDAAYESMTIDEIADEIIKI